MYIIYCEADETFKWIKEGQFTTPNSKSKVTLTADISTPWPGGEPDVIGLGQVQDRYLHLMKTNF